MKITKERDKEVGGRQGMKRTVKNYSSGSITRSKLGELKEIAEKYGKLKQYVFSRYGSVEGLLKLKYHRSVRDEWVDEDREFNMQGRQWKMALDEAFSNIKTTWRIKFNEIRSKTKKFSNEERHYINYILTSYEMVYRVINREIIEPEKFSGMKDSTKTKLLRWLRRNLRINFRKPKQKKHRSFLLDTNMYSYFTRKDVLWISIMSLSKGKRINIPLTSNIKHGRSVRVVLKRYSVEIHETEDVQPHLPPRKENIVAIDKGINPLIHTNTNNIYSGNFTELLYNNSDRQNIKNKKRGKLHSIMKKYKEKNNYKKVELINNNNLGHIKQENINEKNITKLKDCINRQLNLMFYKEQPTELVVEKLKFSKGKKFSKSLNRKMNAWVKGIIRERIDFKCQQNSVLLTQVNPAYTSQLCYCGSLHTERTQDIVHCLDCGRVVNANLLGANNVLNRKYDDDIHLFTPVSEVKKILSLRYSSKSDVDCPILDLSSSTQRINQERIDLIHLNMV